MLNKTYDESIRKCDYYCHLFIMWLIYIWHGKVLTFIRDKVFTRHTLPIQTIFMGIIEFYER